MGKLVKYLVHGLHPYPDSWRSPSSRLTRTVAVRGIELSLSFFEELHRFTVRPDKSLTYVTWIFTHVFPWIMKTPSLSDKPMDYFVIMLTEMFLMHGSILSNAEMAVDGSGQSILQFRQNIVDVHFNHL